MDIFNSNLFSNGFVGYLSVFVSVGTDF